MDFRKRCKSEQILISRFFKTIFLPMVRGHELASGELLLTEGPLVAVPYGKRVPLAGSLHPIQAAELPPLRGNLSCDS